MKLTAVTPITSVPILGIRPSMSNTTRIRPEDPMWAGWSISAKGPAVFIVSPPGWKLGTQQRDGTDRQVCELPRTHCVLEWSAAEGEQVGEVAVVPVKK